VINYEKMLTKEVKEIKPSGIRKFFDIAAEMKDVISLSIGEPDFKTPWNIREAGVKNLNEGATWYSSNQGMINLRQEVCDYQKRRFGVSYHPENECLITVGGSEGIDLIIRALISEGDEVLIPQPCYVAYEPLVELQKGVPVIINTKPENEFRLTGAEIKEHLTDKTKLLILPYPNNPTGAVLTEKELIEIDEALAGTDVLVLSDEIYGELTYEREHISVPSVGSLYERTLLIGGFSKAFAMTGWRLGYVLGPETIIKHINKIHQYAIMCAPTTSQHAAIEALKNGGESVQKMRKEYDMRRRYLLSALSKIGLECFPAKGAFYLFPSIKSTGLSSEEFCTRLLYSKSVAVVPGTAFGESGEGFVRISYSYSLNHLKEAISRIEEFLNEIKEDKN
jgi:aminotransferase